MPSDFVPLQPEPPEAPIALADETRRRVLIVDRDETAVSLLRKRLEQAGFATHSIHDSAQTLASIAREAPDLVMLDWDLAGAMAIDLIDRIRIGRRDSTPRLILVSKLGAEQQIIAGFESGADDYIVKPYSVPEVVARVRAVLRSVRTDEKDPGVIRFHDLQINPADVRVMARGCVVPLRTTEYRQLEFLMRNPERVFSRDQLLRRVWGPDCRANERTVDVTIQRVRKALSRHECDHYVQTVRGVGYRISATVDRRLESTTTPG